MSTNWKSVACSALAVFSLTTGGAYSEQFPADSAMGRIAQKQNVRIGVKFDQPLFGLRDLSGKPVGFDVEIAKIVAAKLGFSEERITWVETFSSNREPFLSQDKVDFIVATYAISDKRKQVVNFAGPYVVGGQDIVVKKGNPLQIGSVDDLAGHKACVISGSEGQSILTKKYDKTEVVPFDVISKCAEALKNGSVDAIVTSNFILAGLVTKNTSTLELIGQPFTVEPWGVGVQKVDVDLCHFVQTVLTDADKDGSYKELYDRILKPSLGGDGKLPPQTSCP